MAKYRCMVCGYIYDEAEGDLEQNVSPGTIWEEVSNEWVYPGCSVNKSQFEKMD